MLDFKKNIKQNYPWLILTAVTLVAVFLFADVLSNRLSWQMTVVNDQSKFSASPKTYNRLLDGLVIDQEDKIIPWAVIIENSWKAWPVSGLDKASVVYESLAESGIPRFLAIFYPQENITEIGPVRSVRPYFIDWTEGYRALLAHVGGSPQALSRLRLSGNLINLDQIGAGERYFWRDSQRTAPHNVYISSDLLNKAIDKKMQNSAFLDLEPGRWQFKDDLLIFERPKENSDIVVDFSTYAYRVTYKYDRAYNNYLRYQGGKAQLTRGGEEIRAKNVIIIYAPTYLVDSLRLGMQTVGNGRALICLDGVCKQGQWQKKSNNKRERFFYEEGIEVEFNRGVTFVEVLPE